MYRHAYIYIYIYIYICVCVCRKKWVESDRMYVEKVKRKKNVWWFVYFCHKTGNTTNSSVSHNILTNHTLDFQNSAIFTFIHDKNKRRIIEPCSIAHNTTTTRFFQNFTIYRKNNIKRIQNSHNRLVRFSLNIQSNKMSQIHFSIYKMPFTFQKNSITWHDAIWTYQPVLSVFFT